MENERKLNIANQNGQSENLIVKAAGRNVVGKIVVSPSIKEDNRTQSISRTRMCKIYAQKVAKQSKTEENGIKS